jgi:hypothetical protein
MEWIPIEGFPGYSVNRDGQVRNDDSGRLMASNVNQYGVVYVGLSRNSIQSQRSVARLVARTFLPRHPGRMDTPINLNGDRHDNRVENLAWRPRWYAVEYFRQFRERYKNPIDMPIIDRDTGEKYRDSRDCALANGLLEKDVVMSILNRGHTPITFQRFEVL